MSTNDFKTGDLIYDDYRNVGLVIGLCIDDVQELLIKALEKGAQPSDIINSVVWMSKDDKLGAFWCNGYAPDEDDDMVKDNITDQLIEACHDWVFG